VRPVHTRVPPDARQPVGGRAALTAAGPTGAAAELALRGQCPENSGVDSPARHPAGGFPTARDAWPPGQPSGSPEAAGRRPGGFPGARDAGRRGSSSLGRQDAVLTALRDLRELRESREAGHEGRPDPLGHGDLDRLLPVPAALAGLLPRQALARGTTVAVEGSAALLLTLLAEPSRAGAWCAVVGCPALGLLAAAEAGIALERLILVPEPGPRWPAVTAALIDALDVVAVRPPAGEKTAGPARRLAARARERGCVLLPVGDGWEGADLRIAATERSFHGLGQGHGHLRSARLLVRVSGRGAATRARHGWLTVAGTAPAIPADSAAFWGSAAFQGSAAGLDHAEGSGAAVADPDGSASPRRDDQSPGAPGPRVVEGAA